MENNNTTTITTLIKDKKTLIRSRLRDAFPQQYCFLEVEKHTYKVNDKKMYSVSSILEPISVGIKRIPSSILNAASTKGSMIHDIIDNITKGLDTLENNKHIPDVEFYFNTLTLNGITPIVSEFKVWDNDSRIAGTIDMIGIDTNNNICVVDLKTGSMSKKTHNLQVEIYNMLLKKHFTDIPIRNFILYTNEKLRILKESTLGANEKDILSCIMNIFQWNKDEKEI